MQVSLGKGYELILASLNCWYGEKLLVVAIFIPHHQTNPAIFILKLLNVTWIPLCEIETPPIINLAPVNKVKSL